MSFDFGDLFRVGGVSSGDTISGATDYGTDNISPFQYDSMGPAQKAALDFLTFSQTNRIELTPGQLSLSDFVLIISQLISKLKEALVEGKMEDFHKRAEYLQDILSASEFTLSAADQAAYDAKIAASNAKTGQANDKETDLANIQATIDTNNDTIGTKEQEKIDLQDDYDTRLASFNNVLNPLTTLKGDVQDTLDAIEDAYDTFDSAMTTLYNEDVTAVTNLTDSYVTYNGPLKGAYNLSSFLNNPELYIEKTAKFNGANNQLNEYNDHASSRTINPDARTTLQDALSDYQADIESYNTTLDNYNQYFTMRGESAPTDLSSPPAPEFSLPSNFDSNGNSTLPIEPNFPPANTNYQELFLDPPYYERFADYFAPYNNGFVNNFRNLANTDNYDNIDFGAAMDEVIDFYFLYFIPRFETGFTTYKTRFNNFIENHVDPPPNEQKMFDVIKNKFDEYAENEIATWAEDVWYSSSIRQQYIDAGLTGEQVDSQFKDGFIASQILNGNNDRDELFQDALIEMPEIRYIHDINAHSKGSVTNKPTLTNTVADAVIVYQGIIDNDETLNNLQSDLDALTADISTLQTANNTLEDDITTLEGEIGTLRTQAANLLLEAEQIIIDAKAAVETPQAFLHFLENKYLQFIFQILQQIRFQIHEEDTLFEAANLIFPKGWIQSKNPVFLTSLGGVGGVGGTIFNLGPQTQNIEIILSTSMYLSLLREEGIPSNNELIKKLIKALLKLLLNASLLSSTSALNVLKDVLGKIGPDSAAINLGAAGGLAEELTQITNSNIPNFLANSMLTELSTNFKIVNKKILDEIKTSEDLLKKALSTGDSQLIQTAFNRLTKAELALVAIKELSETLGSLSIGKRASIAKKIAAAIILSLLLLALKQLGRSLSMPNLVPTLFANLEGLPTIDAIAAMIAPEKIQDFLASPLNVIALKQLLTDLLVSKRGMKPGDAAKLINQAINNILAGETISSFNQLRVALLSELSKLGLSPLEANLLTNAAVTAILGDLGQPLLNAAFNETLKSDEIANTLGSSLIVQKAEIGKSKNTSSTLKTSIDRALDDGPFETQREFRDRVKEELEKMGFSQKDAIFLANNAAVFGLTGEITPIYGVSDTKLTAIEDSLVTSLAEEFGEQASQEIVDGAIEQTKNQGPFSTEDAFLAILRENISQSILEKTGRDDGNDLFDRAIASLEDPNTIVSLDVFISQIGTRILEMLNEEMNEEEAERIKDEIIRIIFGPLTPNEAGQADVERPLSLFNQIQTQITELLDRREEAGSNETVRIVKELIETITKPKATTGFILQSLMDNPTTFISNLAMASQRKRSVDIPV